MHIPDGFLATKVLIPAWAISAGTLVYSVKKATAALKERAIPLMGVTAAFIFVAQMLNFPVLAGTSGHLLGGVLSVILLGPYSATIILACVLVLQCLVFQDGGITALGANMLNMAVIATLGGYLIYAPIYKIFPGRKGILLAAFIASWFSVVSAAAACAAELSFSGIAPLSIVMPAMIFVHAIIGLAEGIITVIIVGVIIRIRPDLIYPYAKENPL